MFSSSLGMWEYESVKGFIFASKNNLCNLLSVTNKLHSALGWGDRKFTLVSGIRNL